MLKRIMSMLEGLNAMSLALGVIIGGAIGKVVTSLTGDLLMPILSLVIPGGSWRDAQFVLRRDAAGAVVNSIKVGSAMGSSIPSPPTWANESLALQDVADRAGRRKLDPRSLPLQHHSDLAGTPARVSTADRDDRLHDVGRDCVRMSVRRS